MCWMTPMALTLGEEARTRRVGLVEVIFSGGAARPMEANNPARVGQQKWAAPPAPVVGLGSAQAGSRWGWATPMSAVETAVRPASVASTKSVGGARLEESIAEAGRLMGRSVDAIWAEAAREWLGRHLGMAMIAEADANDDPPPTTPAAMAVAPRRGRCWAEIDSLLADLRNDATPQTAA